MCGLPSSCICIGRGALETDSSTGGGGGWGGLRRVAAGPSQRACCGRKVSGELLGGLVEFPDRTHVEPNCPTEADLVQDVPAFVSFATALRCTLSFQKRGI